MSNEQQQLAEARASYDAGDLLRAEAICRSLIRCYPACADAFYLLAHVARKTNRPDDALAAARKAVELAPNHPLYLFEYATCQRLRGADEEALELLERVVRIKPDFQEAFVNLGGILEELERFDEALRWCRRAVDLRPRCAIALYNLANVERHLGRLGESIALQRRALKVDPGYGKAHWNLAISLLTVGEFAEGWRQYEHRQQVGEVTIDRYEQPRWAGEPLAGKTLLVHAEQGIGDEILFASCYPEVLARADRCVLVCEPRLAELYRRSFPQASIYPWQRRKDGSPCPVAEHVDVQIPAGSLPLYLRPDAESFPRAERFLLADRQQIAQWRQRLDPLGPGLKIGISWRAGGKPSEQRKRTTSLEQWLPILTTPGAHFVNLQYGDASEDIARLKRRCGIKLHDWPEADPLVDLDAMAAKVSALDLVISVGNATVHLAGALGTPAWCLLPLVPAWRWMMQRQESPWYRRVRLLRQSRRGDWAPVFERVAGMLHEKLGVSRPAVPAPKHWVAQPAATASAAIDVNDSPTSPEIRSLDLRSSNFGQAAVDAAIEQGIQLHRAGKYAEAESVYRQVLRHLPRYPDAQHLLGVLALQTGRTQLAITSIERALAADDSPPAMHHNLGNAYRQAGRIDQAIASYQRALDRSPDMPEALVSLARMLVDEQRLQEAVPLYRRWTQCQSDVPQAWIELGDVLRGQCAEDEARAAYQRAIDLAPDNARAHDSLGALLLADGDVSRAIDCFRRAIEFNPHSAVAHNNLGNALNSQQRFAEAATCYEQALAERPDSVGVLCNLASAQRLLGQFDAALANYRRAVELQPRNGAILDHYAQVLHDVGRWDEALATYDQALALDSGDAAAHCHRALLQLQRGSYQEGWRQYEWRWFLPEGPRPRQHFAQPLWDGSSLAGKTILVHGEQGVGDEIMFATCLPDVIKRAGRCVVTCNPRLRQLFARSFPQATMVPLARGHEQRWQPPRELGIDVQIPAGSLPRYLRPTAASFPRQRRLLWADPIAVDRWSQRLAQLGPGLKVGVSWRAGTKAIDRVRRWTELRQWLPVLSAPNVQFVNLQYGDCRQELSALQSEHGLTIHDWPNHDPLGDLDEAAAQIAALDLVIATGNASVHLAGALGIRTWCLLGKFWGWRWPEPQRWYESVEVFRQAELGDWDELFARLRRQLDRLIGLPPRTKADAGHQQLPPPRHVGHIKWHTSLPEPTP